MELTDSEFDKLLKEALESNEEPSDVLKAKLDKKLDEKIRTKKSSRIFDINSFRGLKTAAAAAIVVVTTVGIVTNSNNLVPVSQTPVIPFQEKVNSQDTFTMATNVEIEDDKKIKEPIKTESSKKVTVKENDKKNVTWNAETESAGADISQIAVVSEISEETSVYTPPGDVPEKNIDMGRRIVDSNSEEMQVAEDAFEIKTEVKNVNNKGLTLIVNHNGVDTVVSTGADFYIEKLDNEEWVQLKTIEDEVFWNMIAYSFPSEQKSELEIGWEYLYGDLEFGKYRIVKQFSYLTDENIQNAYTTVTEFEIAE